MKCNRFARQWQLPLLLLGMFVSWQLPTTAAGQTGRHAADFTDQLMVKFRDDVPTVNKMSAVRLERLTASAGLPLAQRRSMSGQGHVISLPARMTLVEAQAVAAKLMQDPDVEYAEPDKLNFPLLTPNDTHYPSQWHYKSPSAPDNIPGGANLPGAWDITTGSSAIVSAVIDTGIVNHADLDGRTVPGYNFISDADMAGNGVGRSPDPSDLGDWITPADDNGTTFGGKFVGCGVSDSSWHGTHVAGTIGAKTGNSAGVAGINWVSKILPVRVLGKCGGYDSDIIDGMRWAAGLAVPGVPANANPARVLNLSLGGTGSCSTFYQTAIDEITAAGAVIVVAAGNENMNAASSVPANCNDVISVAAVGKNGARAYYSNFGSSVKIAAPGGDQQTGTSNGVLSTLNSGKTTPIASPGGDDYIFYQGTSMATPHVTGIVSLMLSANSLLTPAKVQQKIQLTSRPFPAGTGNDCTTTTCGSGIIDAAAAVNSATKVTPDTVPGAPVIGTELAGDGKAYVTFSPPAYTGGSAIISYMVTSNPGTISATGPSSPIVVSGLSNGTTYTFTATATNGVGTGPASAPSKSVTPTTVIPGGNLLLNADFEVGPLVWGEGSSGYYELIINDPGQGYNSSNWYAYLGDYSNGVDYITQDVTVPAADSVSLDFYAGITTLDSDVTAKDFLYVQVADPPDSTQRTTLATYSNLNAQPNWQYFDKIDLSPYSGKTVRLYFYATNDASGDTAFFIDNVKLTYAAPVVTTFTVSPSAGANGSISPNSPQSVSSGSTAVFTITPATDYKTVTPVGGTCPQGTLTGTSYTTGTIVADCTVEATFVHLPVNGVCGASNGGSFVTPPNTGFCSVGNPSVVSGSGPWNWTCSGQYGGEEASCSANKIVPIAINGGATYVTGTAVTLSLEAPNGYTGLRLRNGDKKWGKLLPLVTPMPWKLASGDGNKTVSVQFSKPDNTLSGVYSDTIILDKKKPAGKLLINNKAKITTSRNVSLTITATDITSGVQSVCISESKLPCPDDGFVPFAASLTHTITNPENGKKTIYATLKDKAGNRSSILKASIKLLE